MAPPSRRGSRRKKRTNVNDASQPITPSPSSNSSSSESTPSSSLSNSGRSRRPDQTPSSLFQKKDYLFNLMKSSSVDFHAVVSAWINSYKVNRSSASSKLLEFFINSSGCSVTIIPEMIADFNDTTKEFIVEACKDGPKVFPLTTKTSPWKTFTSNLVEFLRVLLLQCQNSIIYDDFLLKSLTYPLQFFSSCSLACLRYTSTLILLKLTSILEEIETNVQSIIKNNKRQLDAEVKKPPGEKSVARIETLELKQIEFQENRDFLTTFIINISSNLFPSRFRDVFLEIRLIAIEEQKILLDKKPLKYVDRLKYIGYGLSDVAPEVRLKCIKILQSLYQSAALKGQLNDFSNKFKKRFIAMSRDKNQSVGVEAIKFMTIIYQHHRDILIDSDYEQIYHLVYCKHRDLALVAGEFIKTICSEIESDDADVDSSYDSVISQLVAFFAESERPEHAVYLVDALIDDNEFMQDWACMTKLLLNEELEDTKVVSLVKLMVASVELSATGEIPPGRAPRKKILTKGEKREIFARKERLTEYFIMQLPRLLAKFGNDSDVVSNLLMIPQYFYLDMYVTSHQEMKLTHLLDEIKIIVERTNDLDTLRAASKTLEWLCSQPHKKTSQCKTATNNIISSIIQNYKIAMNDYESIIADDPTSHDDEIADVVQAVKKIAIFSRCHDLRLDTWESTSVLGIIDSCKTPASDFEDALGDAVFAAYYSILWGKNRLKSNEIPEDRGEEEARKLKDMLVKFIEDMKFFLTTENQIALGIRADVFKVICDLLVLFNEDLYLEPNPLLHRVIYKPNEDLGNTLNDFLQLHVFIQDDSQSIEFYTRRNLLMAFCKLITCSVFEMKIAFWIFRHYHKFYNDYGDIIKMTVMKAKEINKLAWALTVHECLTRLYEETREVDSDGSGEIMGIIALAKRFAVALGIDMTRIKSEVSAIHLAGIAYVVGMPDGEVENTDVPPRIGYLEVLVEFSGKLSEEEKNVVLKVVDSKLLAGTDARGSDWQPLIKYRTSLNARKGGGRRKQTPRKAPLTVTRVRGRTPRAPAASDESEENTQSVSRFIVGELRRDEDNRRKEGADCEAEGQLDEPMETE